jgi:hypothetical protein
MDTLSEIEIAFEGIVDDSGIVPADDIAEGIGVAVDTLKRWFGKGKRARQGYQKKFEMFENEEDKGRTYFRRKNGSDNGK